MLNIHRIRMGTFLIFLVIAIVAGVKEQRRTVHLCVCFCILILVSHVYIFSDYIDIVRFHILKPLYQKRAEAFLEEEKLSDDEEDGCKYKNSRSCLFLTTGHDYEIHRKGRIISVYFPTSANFFSGSGYIYTENDPDAADLVYTQNENILMTITAYDRIQFLDDHWAYIKKY